MTPDAFCLSLFPTLMFVPLADEMLQSLLNASINVRKSDTFDMRASMLMPLSVYESLNFDSASCIMSLDAGKIGESATSLPVSST